MKLIGQRTYQGSSRGRLVRHLTQARGLVRSPGQILCRERRQQLGPNTGRGVDVDALLPRPNLGHGRVGAVEAVRPRADATGRRQRSLRIVTLRRVFCKEEEVVGVDEEVVSTWGRLQRQSP